ncbi:hypothetical protein PSHT_15237 [Puccinia striiformis]|uniref:Vacuolar-sorting protein SNF7 n=1 Tax=Puccinia striiformis TaxID=27350 RepID=A0A2S4UGC9_9BASI|nr:hypothetical protein PSHT_15237 [Puccinia striiformis]
MAVQSKLNGILISACHCSFTDLYISRVTSRTGVIPSNSPTQSTGPRRERERAAAAAVWPSPSAKTSTKENRQTQRTGLEFRLIKRAQTERRKTRKENQTDTTTTGNQLHPSTSSSNVFLGLMATRSRCQLGQSKGQGSKKIEDELRKAKANATTNKRAATAALRQKKLYEQELDRLAGRRMTLETQVNAIESANMNLETMQAMRRGADVLKGIHGNLNIDKVDATMDSIREQMDLTNEISDAISNPVGMGQELDEDEIKAELEELEQDELKSRLVGADSVPLHSPGQTERPVAARTVAQRQQEEDEDAELKELQAALAM